jgi:hypothetical protein
MTRAWFLGLAILLGCSAAAFADDPPAALRQPSLTIPTIVFAGAAVSDWAVTYHGLATHKFDEGNPLIRRWQHRPLLMVGAGAAIDVGEWLLWNRFVGREHPKLAVAGLYAAAVYRSYLAGRGLRFINAPGAPVTPTP